MYSSYIVHVYVLHSSTTLSYLTSVFAGCLSFVFFCVFFSFSFPFLIWFRRILWRRCEVTGPRGRWIQILLFGHLFVSHVCLTCVWQTNKQVGVNISSRSKHKHHQMHSNNEKTHETQGKYTQLAKKYTKRTSAQTQTKKTNKNKHMVASNDNKQLTVMCQQISKNLSQKILIKLHNQHFNLHKSA